jgi:hypothetical protein
MEGLKGVKTCPYIAVWAPKGHVNPLLLFCIYQIALFICGLAFFLSEFSP